MYLLKSCRSTTGYETRFENLSQFTDIFYGPVQATHNASDYKSREHQLKLLRALNPYRLEFSEMDQRYLVQRHQKKLCRNQIRVLVNNQRFSRCSGNDQ